MVKLDDLAIKYSTDKGSVVGPDNPWFEEGSKGHSYCEIYEDMLSPFIDKECKILELGILDGGSLRMWREYLPNSVVVGLDKFRPSGVFDSNTHIYIGDVTDEEFINNVIKMYGTFDIIIDDASHITLEQCSSYSLLKDSFKYYYVIEDSPSYTVFQYISYTTPENRIAYNKELLIIDKEKKW